MLADEESACESPLMVAEAEAPSGMPGWGRARPVAAATATGLLAAWALLASSRASGRIETRIAGVISASSEKCAWHSKGEGTYCRLDPDDSSWMQPLSGTTKHKLNIASLEKCKEACEDEDGCHGIEWHHGFSGHCELWMKPIGHFVHQDGGWNKDVQGIYECFSYDCEAKDACGAAVGHWCEASDRECHVHIPHAQQISHLFPNNCGKDTAFEYVMHFHNDNREEVTVEADTCDPDLTLFDTTIAFFRPGGNGMECEHVHCNDDTTSCSAKTCNHEGQFRQNSYCDPDHWIKCCSTLQTTVPADGELVIVVSSYHEILHRFKKNETAGFYLKAKVIEALDTV